MKTSILALDQGTTSSRAMLFDESGSPLEKVSRGHRQHFPQPGWVEHDPEEIATAQLAVAREVLDRAESDQIEIAALGITNQRETAILWDRRDGRPVYNAIVWQDRRTTNMCDELRAAGWDDELRTRTGLVLDPCFSALKISWLLDQVPGLRDRAERGEIAFGTVDSFLVYRLTGGRLHVTDVSNASRTMLFNIHRLDWDDDILRELRIPRAILPEVVASSGFYGTTDRAVLGREVPICGIAGDQQAATFGQACYAVGSSKQTFGTGSFMLMNTGQEPVASQHGLLTTIAWQMNDQTTYALEGSAFIAGAAIQWLRDELGIISEASDTAELASSVPSSGGVYFVPAFFGLGVPDWDANARGTLLGLTRGSGRAEIARATLEAIAYQTRDQETAMAADFGGAMNDLRVDGGMASNDVFLQILADVLGATITRPAVIETTALGVALLAGLGVGLWSGLEEVEQLWKRDRLFQPMLADRERDAGYRGWRRAVERSRNWIETDP